MDRYDEAKAAAIDLIEVYVVRGDSYEFLRSGGQSSHNPRYRAGIGSFGWTECRAKPAAADTITVSRLGEEDVCYHFSLRKLYDEIKGGAGQLTLF